MAFHVKNLPVAVFIDFTCSTCKFVLENAYKYECSLCVFQGRIELLKSGTQLLYRYKDAQAAA